MILNIIDLESKLEWVSLKFDYSAVLNNLNLIFLICYNQRNKLLNTRFYWRCNKTISSSGGDLIAVVVVCPLPHVGCVTMYPPRAWSWHSLGNITGQNFITALATNQFPLISRQMWTASESWIAGIWYQFKYTSIYHTKVGNENIFVSFLSVVISLTF